MVNFSHSSGPQRGNVMLSVMVISAILMAIGATLYNSYIVGEADSVEKSLLEVRTYWAMMGHANYMIGRVGAQGVCPRATTDTINTTSVAGGDCTNSADDDPTDNEKSAPPFGGRAHRYDSRVASMQYYLEGDSTKPELHDQGARSLSSPGARRWYYPQDMFDDLANSGNNYHLDITSVVTDITSGTKTFPNGDGRMRLDLSVKAVGSVPVLLNLENRLPSLTVGFCVYDQYGINDNGTLADLSDDVPLSRTASSKCGPNPSVITTPKEGRAFVQFIEWNKPTQ